MLLISASCNHLWTLCFHSLKQFSTILHCWTKYEIYNKTDTALLTNTYACSYTTTPPHHNRFTAIFPGPPGWAGARRTSWCKGTLTEADTLTIRLCVTIRTNYCPPPLSPRFVQAGCSSCHPTNINIHSTCRSACRSNHVTVALHSTKIWPFEFRQISIVDEVWTLVIAFVDGNSKIGLRQAVVQVPYYGHQPSFLSSTPKWRRR